MTEAALIAARFAHYTALVLAFGAFAYAGFGNRANAAVATRLGRLAIASNIAVFAASLAVLVATTAGLAGGFGGLWDEALWSTILLDTDFGQVWSARSILALGLVVVALFGGGAKKVWTRSLGVLAAGALLVSVALTGHAQVESGAAGMIHKLADAIHLAAAGVWLGALVPFLYLLSSRKQPGSPMATAERLVAFHDTGLVAVLLLIGTGLINSWFLVGAPERLLETTYGRVLLVKLALFAGMLVLATGNRLKHVPLLTRELASDGDGAAPIERLRLQVRGEFVLGLLVLLAVAVLGSIAPASEASG